MEPMAGRRVDVVDHRGTEQMMGTPRNHNSNLASKLLLAFGMCAVVAATAALSRTTPATAAPAADVMPALTITKKPAGALSNLPGIRLARISTKDGETCFRASRSPSGGGRTISETFCIYE